MKVEVINKEAENKPKFPCLMKSITDDLYIIATGYFNNAYKGFIIRAGDDVRMIGYDSTFQKDKFTLFNGSVIISND